MWLIDRLAEQRIREAQARGEFDDLPGAGRPLVLDDDTAVPESLRAAYRVLKNAGYLAPDMQLRHQISEAEQLLAMTDDPDERANYSRRLGYLMMRLNLVHSRSENLQVQQAYFEKLCRRVT